MDKIVWYKILGIALCLIMILSAAVIAVQRGSVSAHDNEYSVTFFTWGPGTDPDNSMRDFTFPFDEQVILPGGTCDDPGDPTVIPPGYVFIGWYVMGEEDPFDFSTPVYSDLILHARFDRDWSTTVQAGTIAEIKAAIAAAGNDDPLAIELTADITFTAAGNTITVPADKVIKFTSADVPGAPFKIDAAGLARVINVAADGTLYLKNITITGGYAPSDVGGGINNAGILVVNQGTVIRGNEAGNYGGGIHNSYLLIVNAGESIFENKSYYGGGIANRGANAEFTMNGGNIHDNIASFGGGVYNGTGGTFVFNSGEIFGHNVSGDGGGVYNAGIFEMWQEGITVTTKINENKAYWGGGVYSTGTNAKFDISGGIISDNIAGDRGGGVFIDERAVFNMSGGFISNNKAVLGSTAAGFGGGLCVWWGSADMSGGEISGNEARFGGGVFNYLGCVFNMSGDALISKNKGMYGQYSSGGGVYNYGLFTMYDNAAILGNTAPWGGGVFNEYNTFVMEDGMLWGNYSTTGNGGGIYVNHSVDPNSNVQIRGGIVANNTTVANGGGIWVAYTGLDKVRISSGVEFFGNSAASAYDRDPSDDALYNAQIGINGAGVTWTDPFLQGYNNYDIGYSGTPRLMLVTFMQNYSPTDDTVIKTIAVEINTAIDTQMPPDPIRADYVFKEWNTSRGGTGTVYTDSAPVVAANTVLYAQWTAAPPSPPARYTVTYYGNGHTSGTAPVDSGSYLRGDNVTVLGEGGLVKTDHVFLGWATDPRATSATYLPGSSFRIQYNTYLYALWQSDYIVTFLDWDNTVLKTEHVPHGGSAVAPDDPVREGYTFIGWDKAFDNITSDLTVKALYETSAGSSHSAPGEWALLNLILAMIGIVVAIVAVVYAMRMHRKFEEEWEMIKKDSDTAQYEDRSFALLFIAAIIAVIGIVFFFITEDVRLPMTIIDEWTIVNVLLFIGVAIVSAVFVWRKEREYDDLKQEDSGTAGE